MKHAAKAPTIFVPIATAHRWPPNEHFQTRMVPLFYCLNIDRPLVHGMNAQRIYSTPSPLVIKIRQERYRLAELSERAAALFDFDYQSGMAILRTEREMCDGDLPVRIMEYTGFRLTVIDPKSGIVTLRDPPEPVIDLTDPATFGCLFALGASFDDAEADRAYAKMDFGCLESSARVILDLLEERLPF